MPGLHSPSDDSDEGLPYIGLDWYWVVTSSAHSSLALCRLQQLLLAWDYFDLDERLTNEQGALQQELKAVPATFNNMQVSLACCTLLCSEGRKQKSGACTGPLTSKSSLHNVLWKPHLHASLRTLSFQMRRLCPIKM